MTCDLSVKAVDVPVAMLVGIQWQMKLSGLATRRCRL